MTAYAALRHRCSVIAAFVSAVLQSKSSDLLDTNIKRESFLTQTLLVHPPAPPLLDFHPPVPLLHTLLWRWQTATQPWKLPQPLQVPLGSTWIRTSERLDRRVTSSHHDSSQEIQSTLLHSVLIKVHLGDSLFGILITPKTLITEQHYTHCCRVNPAGTTVLDRPASLTCSERV